VTNDEWVELQRREATLEQQRDAAKGSAKAKLTRALNILYRRSNACRHCGKPSDAFYMFNRWLNSDGSFRWAFQPYQEGAQNIWRDIVAPSAGYRTGFVCLPCLAERVPGHRLFYEDFTAEGAPAVDLDAEVDYSVHFPARRAQKRPTVRIRYCFFDTGAPAAEQEEALFASTDWLLDYCKQLGWRLRFEWGSP